MEESRQPRFYVDGMLGKLGSYLRCMGYDAAHEPERSTATRIERANREERVFLTRNRRLPHHHPLPARSFVVQAADPLAQLREVCEAFGLEARLLFTRCIRCNVPLTPIGREEVCGRVPGVVYRSYRSFYQCPSCGTLFWKGSHVRNTCRKLGLADASEPGQSEGLASEEEGEGCEPVERG